MGIIDLSKIFSSPHRPMYLLKRRMKPIRYSHEQTQKQNQGKNLSQHPQTPLAHQKKVISTRAAAIALALKEVSIPRQSRGLYL